MPVVNPPGYLQSNTVSHPASLFRRVTDAQSRPGIVDTGALEVTQNGTPNMSVNVATGRALIQGTQSVYQGMYLFDNQGVTNVVVTAADSVNPRRDLVVARIYDSQYSGALNTSALEVITGTPAPSPADPPVPDNCLVLARIQVAANASSITNANITDLRTTPGLGSSNLGGRAVGLGGVITCTSTTRPTTGLREGFLIYETNTNRLYTWNGSAWRYVASTDSEEFDGLSFAPGANVDATTSGTMTDWLTLGNVTVPPWATRARVHTSLTFVAEVTAAGNEYVLRTRIGTAAAVGRRFLGLDTTTRRMNFSWANPTLSLGGITGSQSVVVQAQRIAGTGQFRMGANGDAVVMIDWLP